MTVAATSRSRQLPAVESVARLIWAATIGVILGYPLFELFRKSLFDDAGHFTLDNYQQLFQDPELLTAFRNSLWIGAGTVAGSMLLAVPLAYLVSRTDMPFKRFFNGSIILTFAAPSFIAALGWILLLGTNGLLNNALESVFGLDGPPINIFTPWGIIFVLSTFLYPLVYLPLSAAFENIDASMEQAASSLGASRLRVMRQITLPLVLPALFGGGMLVFVTGFVIFGPVAILGSPSGFETIPMVLLDLISAPPRIEAAAVMGVPVLVVIAVIVILQRKILGGRRFTVVGGKASPRSPIRLKGATIPALIFAFGVFAVSILLPFGVLVLTSFRRAVGMPLSTDNLVLRQNYERVLENPQIVSAFRNSFVLGLGATAIGVALALLAAWLVHRTRSRLNSLIGPAMLSPLAFPGAVLGIALIIAFARPPFALAGSVTILLIAYTVQALPLAYAYIHAAMSQIGPELEEASRSLGAGWGRTWFRVTLPLMRSSIVAVSLLSFVLLFRELEMSVFLYTGANPTVATVLYELTGESLFQLVGALSVIVLAVNVIVVLVAIKLMGSKHPVLPV